MTSIGERIAKTRAEIGYSTGELARRAGVKKDTLEHWEAGITEPRPNKLMQLAGILEVSLMWLMTGVAAEDEGRVYEFDRLARVNRKLERALALQAETSRLVSEAMEEIGTLKQEDANVA